MELVSLTRAAVVELESRGTARSLLRAIAILPVQDIEVTEAKLEDVILKYYREGGSAGKPGRTQ